MSTENLERAKAMWLGDFDLTLLVEGGPELVEQVFQSLSPDVRSEFIAQNAQASLSYEGIDGLYEGWKEWLGPWSSYVISMREAVEAGPDEVVVMGTADARTSRDAVHMEHRPAAVITFDDDGVVSRVRFFLDTGDALRAAGLEAS